MKRFKIIFVTILAVLPTVYTAASVLFILPETVAAHFGIDLTVDRYGSKYEAFIIPAIILATYIAYFFIRKFAFYSSTDDDSRTRLNLDVFDTAMMLVYVLLNTINVFELILMAKPEIAQSADSLTAVILSALVGIIFILLGNIMPKTKRNSFIGIRMRFTMDTDEHWYIANRSCGIAMMLGGFCTIIAGLVVRNFSFIFYMILSLILFLTVATIYSYVIIKKK